MSKFSSRSPSKKNSFQIDNLLQPSNRESKNVNISNIESNNISISNRESKNVNISNRESKNVNISNRESKNVNISNRESKNINSIKIKQQQSIKNSVSSSNRDSKKNYNPKTKTEQNYFEIKKELQKELGLSKDKNEKTKKKSFVDNLYLKNKDEVNNYLENNQTNINLIGTKEISDLTSSQTIKTIKSNQNNWTKRIPG